MARTTNSDPGLAKPRKRFQRARNPQEKDLRKVAILATADKITAAAPFADLTLASVARSVGVSKSNIYRYFESASQLRLAVHLIDSTAFVDDLIAKSKDLSPGKADRFCKILVETLLRHSRYCGTLSRVPLLLGSDMSKKAQVGYRSEANAIFFRGAAVIEKIFPDLKGDAAALLFSDIMIYVSGLFPWQRLNSQARSAVQVRGLERPNFDLHRTLTRAIKTLIGGHQLLSSSRKN